ncbi:helix-turn-helix domain-containing protein [Haloglomus salinum]|jgi:predicted DNA binding protein|uniref:helix-turn-helix domain-containing protein n=1 Tax=Haloglomus salinum TaxID=2962673 RepID=UPI0020C99693|nr:helix-turn-helix domain-containing protein [Haloglomus salinum]
MKHIRITVRPDIDRAPPFLRYLLEAEAHDEARAIDWNRGDSELSTHIYGIAGDGGRFAELAQETAGVESVELSAADARVSYALIELRDAELPIFGGSATAIDRTGLVVRRPLVYRDGRIHGHIVGDPATLQATLDDLPESVSVQIDAIQQFPSADVNPATTLSDRQQEALEVAVELGYYDTPREATHTDIAAELDCAPNTASDHLQKGEAKLVRAGLTAFTSSL